MCDAILRFHLSSIGSSEMQGSFNPPPHPTLRRLKRPPMLSTSPPLLEGLMSSNSSSSEFNVHNTSSSPPTSPSTTTTTTTHQQRKLVRRESWASIWLAYQQQHFDNEKQHVDDEPPREEEEDNDTNPLLLLHGQSTISSTSSNSINANTGSGGGGRAGNSTPPIHDASPAVGVAEPRVSPHLYHHPLPPARRRDAFDNNINNEIHDEIDEHENDGNNNENDDDDDDEVLLGGDDDDDDESALLARRRRHRFRQRLPQIQHLLLNDALSISDEMSGFNVWLESTSTYRDDDDDDEEEEEEEEDVGNGIGAYTVGDGLGENVVEVMHEDGRRGAAASSVAVIVATADGVPVGVKHSTTNIEHNIMPNASLLPESSSPCGASGNETGRLAVAAADTFSQLDHYPLQQLQYGCGCVDGSKLLTTRPASDAGTFVEMVNVPVSECTEHNNSHGNVNNNATSATTSAQTSTSLDADHQESQHRLQLLMEVLAFQNKKWERECRKEVKTRVYQQDSSPPSSSTQQHDSNNPIQKRLFKMMQTLHELHSSERVYSEGLAKINTIHNHIERLLDDSLSSSSSSLQSPQSSLEPIVDMLERLNRIHLNCILPQVDEIWNTVLERKAEDERAKNGDINSSGIGAIDAVANARVFNIMDIVQIIVERLPDLGKALDEYKVRKDQ